MSLHRDALPTEVAIFPLGGALLLPGGRLPLNIFEPRYLTMVEDALASGRLFGMIQPDRTRPAGSTGPGLYRVGCLGRLSSFSETEDGRYLITLTGLCRFAVEDELPSRRGYRRVAARYDGFLGDLTVATDDALPDRPALFAALRRYFTARGFEANWDAIDHMPDQMLVVTLCMVCPFEPAEKQALLEAPTGRERAGTLLALLAMGAHDAPDDEPERLRS